MPTISLKYNDGVSDYSRTFSALSLKGFKPSDGHIVFPELRPVYLDGSVRKKQVGFRRVFELRLAPLTADADILHVGLFLNSENQYVTITYDSTTETDLRVVDRHSEYASDWTDGVEIGREIVLILEEATLRTTYPSGTATPDTTVLMYFKKKVSITGTAASIQTLTFGTGALATDENGDTFPTIINATHIYRVEMDGSPYQEARCWMPTDPTINGSFYVTFGAAHSLAGDANDDGLYYCDISLFVKAR